MIGEVLADQSPLQHVASDDPVDDGHPVVHAAGEGHWDDDDILGPQLAGAGGDLSKFRRTQICIVAASSTGSFEANAAAVGAVEFFGPCSEFAAL